MLKIHSTKVGGTSILCLQGRIVRGETATLRNAVNSQTGIDEVVLDLSRVKTIDAGGLGVMLELHEQTRSKGIQFKLSNVTQLVKRVLEITRLDSVFEVSYANRALSASQLTVAARPSNSRRARSLWQRTVTASLMQLPGMTVVYNLRSPQFASGTKSFST